MSEKTFRDEIVGITMQARDCDRDEAEIIVDRIADRLDGHTHDEVAEMHPLPEKDDT